MLPAPCFVAGDAHLGADTSDAERTLLAFLRSLHGRAGSLVINGDLFDFWFEWRTVVPRTGIRVLGALAELREAGIPVLWIAGNHDCWGGDVLRRDLGIDYHDGPWEGSLGGWNARVEHGDGLREREDRGYRRLRTVIRHPWSRRLFRVLHPDFATRIATRSSHTSRQFHDQREDAGLREVAARSLDSRPGVELLIYGHSHVAALQRMGSGVYANAGAWPHGTFLVATPERIELRRWDGSAEGVRLDGLDRRTEKALSQPQKL